MKPDALSIGVNRRQFLAGIATTGAVGVGFGCRYRDASSDSLEYTNAAYTVVQGSVPGPRLRVDWYSTYNGDLLTSAPPGADTGDDGNGDAHERWDDASSNESADDAGSNTGPVVRIPNLLPGDSGTVSMSLLIEDPTESETEHSVWVRRLLPNESGQQLAEVVDIELWYDDGLFGIGGCRGAEDGVYGTPVVTGTLENPSIATASETDDFERGIELDPGFLSDSCLESGQRLCLGFHWSIPEAVTNTYQGSTTTFSLGFRAVNCDVAAEFGNPFEVGP